MLHASSPVLSTTSWSEAFSPTATTTETIIAASTATSSTRSSSLPPEGIIDLFTTASPRSKIATTTSSSTSASEGISDKFISAPSHVVIELTSFGDDFNHFINNQHIQGIVNGLQVGFKHSVRLAGTAAAKGINKVLAKRSYLNLRRLQQSRRRLKHYTTIWAWIQRLAAST